MAQVVQTDSSDPRHGQRWLEVTMVEIGRIENCPLRRGEYQVGRSLYYDAFNRLAEVSGGGGATTNIVYSPDGLKFAWMNGTTVKRYIAPLTTGVEAIYTSASPAPPAYYRHADWLGSSRLATTSSRTVYYDGAYAPFGENYAEMGTTDRSFTGQTQDIVSGLYDFTFRQQSSAQGRWMVPDPAGLAAVDITNPQTWNRYAYVGNNPLMRIDPLGLDDYTISVDAWGDGGGGDGGDEGTGPETSTLYDGSFQYGCSSVVDGLCQDFNFTLVNNVSDRFGGGKGKFHLTNPFTKPKATTQVANIMRCASQFADDHSLAAGLQALTGGAVSQNNILVNAFLGNDVATISNLVTGPNRLQQVTSMTVAQGGSMAGKVIGNLPNPAATGMASLGTAAVSETPAGTAFAASWTDATIATSLFGRGFGKAFFAFSVAKGIYDVSTYAFGAVVCY